MLRVEKISYEIKGRKLVKDISFQVRKGEVVALLGANGAGKSTLMRILCGDIKPDAGTVYLNGKALHDYSLKDLSTCRALLSQQQQISLAFKVREIVMMGRYPHFKSQSTPHDKNVVDEVMAICGVADFENRVFLSLSGGEQQRVQLARVLAQVWDNPDSLILLDEPISALDLQYQQKVLAIAKALSRKGFTVVLVVHDVNFAAMYADKILMLKYGRKLFEGTPIEVLNTKDIYTVFSVESAVEINPRTLKPYVRLEEMTLDASVFNSTLPSSDQGDSTKERRLLLLQQYPCMPIDELATQLDISDFDALLLDDSVQVTYLNADFEQQFAYFPLLKKVKITTQNRSCKHRKTGVYKGGTKHGDVYFYGGKEIDVRWFMSHWSVGLLLEDGETSSIRYYDVYGYEIHRITLLEDVSDFDVFAEIKARFSATKRRLSKVPKVQNKYVDLPEEQQHMWRERWELLQDTHDFQGLIKEFNISRLQAIQYASVHRAQRASIEFLKKAFLTMANDSIPVMLFVYNEGAIQIHTGPITNLVDQGERYMIKDSDFELDIKLGQIGEIWQVSKPTKDGDVHAIEVFDKGGELVLQCFGERKPGHRELGSWANFFQSESVI